MYTHSQNTFFHRWFVHFHFNLYMRWYLLQCGKPFFSITRHFGEWTETITRQDEKSSPCLASDIFFKLANKYQINNTVMFNNLFWQVINLVKKDQHSLKSCVDLFFLHLVIVLDKKTFRHESWHFISVNRKIKYTIPTPHNFAKVDFTIKWNIVSLPIDVMTFKINVN